MKTYTEFYSIIRLLVVAVIVVSLTACGTSRYAPYDDDGIYNSNSGSSEVEETVSEPETNNRNYYKQYFQAKAAVYANEPEGDIIFTDVEGYTSTNAYIDEDGTIYEEDVAYSEAYGPWGDNASVTVNVYSNPGIGYWHRPLWWYGSGWGISYWNYGWGWGGFYGPVWAWHSPFYWNSWYGWGYPYYAYGPYYSPYHSGYSNYVAYNRARRNTDYYRNSQRTARSANTATRSNRSYSRSEINRRINNSRTAENARRSTINSRNNTSVRSSTNQSRNIRGTSPTRNNSSRNISRPNTSTRNSGTINRGGSSVRSGGTSRSGGGRGGRG